MRMRFFTACLAATIAAGLTAGASRAVELPANDYPTAARADYVFACMQTNGQNRMVLDKCSCSIDAIAALLPYAEYEAGRDDHVGAPEGRRERCHVQQLRAAPGEGEEPEARAGRSGASLLLKLAELRCFEASGAALLLSN